MPACRSLPAWAAWIEILEILMMGLAAKSLPAWAAWIEMISRRINIIKCTSLPAWAAWIEIDVKHPAVRAEAVAARMGSVD